MIADVKTERYGGLGSLTLCRRLDTFRHGIECFAVETVNSDLARESSLDVSVLFQVAS